MFSRLGGAAAVLLAFATGLPPTEALGAVRDSVVKVTARWKRLWGLRHGSQPRSPAVKAQ